MHMTLFEIPIPSNLSYFTSLLMSIANFNIIEIFGRESDLVKYSKVFNHDSETPLNKNFEKMGYESMNMFQNNENLFEIIIFILICFVLLSIMKIFCI